VAICALKRFAADYDIEFRLPVRAAERTGQRRPGGHYRRRAAGLSAAYFWRGKGYKTTVFEALPCGGRPCSQWAISFLIRLPKVGADAEIKNDSLIWAWS